MQGQADSKFTNKTEFMRWLDANPSELPTLSVKLRTYRAVYPRGITFGSWLRDKHLAVFVVSYRVYWLKHTELYGKVYQQSPLSV